MAHRPTAAPSQALLMGEQRAVMELRDLFMAAPLLWMSPRGDGHPVLVLPPLLTDDTSTTVLRTFLWGLGYEVHGWELGRNLWRTTRILEGLPVRLRMLHQQAGRPVSLVGWSAGGMFARDLAREHPDLVRQVITLGSPFRHQDGDRSHAEQVSQAFMGSDDQVPHPTDWPVTEEERSPIPVPTTAIYTRTDGIVAWQLCIDVVGPLHENIEVRGTHSGLGFNTAVLVAVADRLAQREGRWERFRPNLFCRSLFPGPTSWRPGGHHGARPRRS